MNVTRRSFTRSSLFGAMASVGTGTASLAAMAEPPAHPGLVYKHTERHFAEFDKLLKFKGRGRQVFDCHPINDGSFLSPMKNCLNGLQFGFDIPAADIKIVGAMHGPANLLNFDDSMWAKYKLGEYLKLNDPETSKPAIRNIYFPKKNPKGSTDPNDRAGIYQDYSLEALQSRGLQLLGCHNSTEGQATVLIQKNALKDPVEDVVADLQSHALPGVIFVPAMVAAIALLQTDGHYAYIAAP
jgi:hypothetical protein